MHLQLQRRHKAGVSAASKCNTSWHGFCEQQQQQQQQQGYTAAKRSRCLHCGLLLPGCSLWLNPAA
jgi:hypothetical protein